MKKLLFILLVLIFSGCAGTYYVVEEDRYNYYPYQRWHWNYTYIINKPHHHIHKPNNRPNNNRPNRPNNKPNNKPNKNKKSRN